MPSAEKAANVSAQSPPCRRKRLARDDARELIAQRPCLAGEHQGRLFAQVFVDALQRALIRPLGLLQGRVVPP